MHFSEYIEYDAVGLAHLIKSGQVSAQEVQQIARQAILAVNPTLNALVGELFEEALPSSTTGPFAGVPFAIKDFSLHAAGVKIGVGTRLTGEGIVFPHDTDLMTRFKRGICGPGGGPGDPGGPWDRWSRLDSYSCCLVRTGWTQANTGTYLTWTGFRRTPLRSWR